MKKQLTSFSLIALLFSCLFILLFRVNNISEKETSWDVLGYYLPLPATFIYEDPLMEDRTWIEEINEERQLTGTLYQISTNDKNEPIYFFLLGMAILYLPFFLIGHGWAYFSGTPLDGFGMPYQYAMVLGAMLYTFIGLIYLRKILQQYFSDKITAVLILIVVFATNYSHHLTLKNLETVNVLFMFVALIIWNTTQWHKTHKLLNLIAIGMFITFMSLVKPSEILILFVPLLWGVYSIETAKAKLKLISKYRIQFVYAFSLCIVLALPQMGYWWVRTGHLFYDSYKNPGVGLDVFSPYILESLFSYKKGWLVYTPVMVLSLVGFYFLVKKAKQEKLSLLTYFLISFYIIVSWTEWWYGAGFSNRPLITIYPILAISMGFLLVEVNKKSRVLKVGVVLFVLACTFLNQFQWWQLRNGILEPYRTTKEYYWATFLATEATANDKEKLLIHRDFGEDYIFQDEESYQLVKTIEYNFDTLQGDFVISDVGGNKFSRFDESRQYSTTFQEKYRDLTQKDHLWVRVKVDCRYTNQTENKNPSLVISMERKEGAYGYYARKIRSDFISEEWNTFSLDYLTPNIRDRSDFLKVFVWNQGKSNFDMDNLKIELFERKN